MAVLKIGDHVVVVNQTSGYRGQAGVITGVHRALDELQETPASYVVEFDNGQLEFFTSTDLELK